MNSRRKLGQRLIEIGGTAIRLALALFSTLLELIASAELERNDDCQLHDADLIGEFNHRTGRLDAGNDPYGWYDD